MNAGRPSVAQILVLETIESKSHHAVRARQLASRRMLLRRETLDGVRRGTISLAYRRWRRPTVRPGGTLMTAAGQLQIGTVATVVPSAITEEEAACAGYSSKDALLADLNRHTEGRIYRIEIGPLQPDPRIALRSTAVAEIEAVDLLTRLERFDAASPYGPWTLQTLRLLMEHPGVRSGDLCQMLGHARDLFKRNVRKLKNLGLTESLAVGYRLSPRGARCLEVLESMAAREPDRSTYM